MTEDYKQQIEQRLTKNLLDIQLLRIMENESMWGYKIKKTFETNLGIKLRHGALYPTLNSLEEQGFLASKKQRYEGRARKTYILTDKGKQYLRSYYDIIRKQLKSQRK